MGSLSIFFILLPILIYRFTPKDFTTLIRNSGTNREATQRYLPPMCRLVAHRTGDTPELRLGAEIAPAYRFLFGYIGLHRKKHNLFCWLYYPP